MISAPFDGVVAAKLMSEGALASPTTPVVTLVTTDVEVMVNIEESRIAQVPQGRTGFADGVGVSGSGVPGGGRDRVPDRRPPQPDVPGQGRAVQP